MYDPKSKTSSSSNSHTYRNPSYSSNGEDHEIGYRNRFGEVQFAPSRNQEGMEADYSGAVSPPMWSPSRPLLTRRGSLSPDSRAQAIARGRSELMEMVRHMPEASYELSLKDIVEHHHRAENQSPAKTGGGSLREEGDSDRRAAAGLKKEESRKFDRKLSFEEKGFFLHMAFPFPFPFRSNKKKKKKIGGGNSGRVSPKPEGLKGGGERDWWKRKFTGSSDSDSSRVSNNSGGSSSTATATTTSSGGRSDSSGRKRNGFTTGCWQIFQLRRSKSG